MSAPVDCGVLKALARNERALVFAGIDSLRDLLLVMRGVERCGMRCEISEGVNRTVDVYAANRRDVVSAITVSTGDQP